MKNSDTSKPSAVKGMTKVFLMFLLTLSCQPAKEAPANPEANESSSAGHPAVSATQDQTSQNWFDHIISDYIKKSNKDLIKAHRRNGDEIEWILDRTEKTDSTNYYIFNIGQTVMDEGDTNPRFSSDGWIYVDSLSKKVYEYDLPNDELVLWSK